MQLKPFLLFTFSLFLIQFSSAQNYLRVENPNSWSAANSQAPEWAEWADHGVFQDIDIVVEPQGIFTEIGFYATITHSPNSWSWSGDFEIIWQFELPNNTIVHDSWLWVGDDIIKADIIDYWTARQIYEDIVDRNQDPSFFYQLPDKRYEIRIYPLFEGESRRIKMSFLVPTKWDKENLVSDLLSHLLQSTDYPLDNVTVAMPLNDLWQTPLLNINGAMIPLEDTLTSPSGDILQYVEINGNDLVSAGEVSLVLPNPFSGNNTFLSTYTQEGDQFYQLAYIPDWTAADQSIPAKKSLFLLDYDASKTDLSKAEFTEQLQEVLLEHFSQDDVINIAVMTTNGIQFLSEDWWAFNENTFADELATIINAQDNVDLASLLSGGFVWANQQDDVSEIFFFSANDNYVYPPVAEEIVMTLEENLPIDIPFTVLDYQNENVSILYYNNQEYHGNEYFHQLLTSHFETTSTMVFRDQNDSYFDVFTDMFPSIAFPEGIIDYNTTLENGICYQRHSLNTTEANSENNGVLLQTGKYLGGFPMNIEANLIKDNGDVLSINKVIEADEIIIGDTLMREMWYGPHLKLLEAQSSSAEDLNSIIEQSINERVLTSLTAFLALEPSQGGEPCIACLLNNGGPILIATHEAFDSKEVDVVITPNPATDFAKIQMSYKENLLLEDWTASIFDLNGRPIAKLGTPSVNNHILEWNWTVGNTIQAGMYICEIQSSFGKIIEKIIIL